ncbi:COX15/CtaA family protein [Undibacterium sp. TC4M20W]|uniref:COX15/CtaA family protein n=1 Tax=Undibacterium sp. TC4M20W TaxID=3413052 RepID=UPI003BF3D131
MWLQIALTALMVAVIPAAMVFMSREKNKYRKLIAVTVTLTFELIMFGAFTRLTDSGLGCPDWPGCYGQSNPLQSHAAIKAAEIAMPTGPVTLQKAWIEMVHRYLAMSVGILIIVQMIIAWVRRRQLASSPWLATFLLFFVCLQGAFGAWTVTLKLQPVIVTTHLILGMGLLALLSASLEQQSSSLAGRSIAAADGKRMLWPATLALLLVFVQISLGGWVSTNYAALACQDYPMCNGQVIPAMDFEHGFSLWRQLGLTRNGDYLPFNALVAIHWVHRNFALLVVAVCLWAALRARKIAGLEKLSRHILLAIVAQFIIGISTVFFSWPLLLAVLHNGMAAMLVLLLTMLNYRIRHVSLAAAKDRS